MAMSWCAHYKKLLVQNEKVFVPREVLLQPFNTNGTMLLGITIGKKTPQTQQKGKRRSLTIVDRKWDIILSEAVLLTEEPIKIVTKFN